MGIVEFREARASAEDPVVEVAIAFVTPQRSHILHNSDSFMVENCHMFMRLFELRISAWFVALRLYPYAD